MRRDVCAVLVAWLPLAACGGGDTAAETPSVVVEQRELLLEVPASGSLTALKASPIAVPRVPTGALKVKQVVPEGSIVAEGDVVVVFDDTQLSIERANYNASFRSADRRIERTDLQAQIETGAIEVMRNVAELDVEHADAYQLLDETVFSKLEILEDEVEKEVAEETILFADASLLLRGQYYDIEERILDVERQQARGKLERVDVSLGQLVLKAPIGGLVVYKKSWRGSTVSVGDTLWPGNVILSIVDPESVALEAYVLEKDAAAVKQGMPAEVRVDARPDMVFRGTVSNVAELSRPIEQGSPVKYTELQVTLEAADPSLLTPGMKAEARIRTAELADALLLPRSAVQLEGEQAFVWLAAEGEPERRDVELGPGDRVRVSVVDGLKPGTRVLLEPPRRADAPQNAESSGGAAAPSQG